MNNNIFRKILYTRNKTGFSMVLIFLMLALFGWRGILNRNAQPTAIPEVTQNSSPLLGYDPDKFYPPDPYSLAEVNNNLVSTLYSETLTEEEVYQALDIQRKLFGQELLKLNPLEAHRANALKQVTAFKEQGVKITSIETQAPIYEPDNPEQCTVTVVQKTNADISNTVEYIMGMENGQWKILSWENV